MIDCTYPSMCAQSLWQTRRVLGFVCEVLDALFWNRKEDGTEQPTSVSYGIRTSSLSGTIMCESVEKQQNIEKSDHREATIPVELCRFYAWRMKNACAQQVECCCCCCCRCRCYSYCRRFNWVGETEVIRYWFAHYLSMHLANSAQPWFFA